jgi:hypothetical protein
MFTTSIGISTMSFLFAWRMTVANSYLGTRWVEGKSAVGRGEGGGEALGLEFTDCDGGMELELYQVHTHGTQRVFLFTALGDIMRGFETATDIDDEATSCIGGTAMAR